MREEDYERILTQPENALTRQYEALLGGRGCRRRVHRRRPGRDRALRLRMNERVENIGARRLHTITERVLEDVSFNAPELAGETVTVDAAFVRERLGATDQRRGLQPLYPLTCRR